MRKDFLLLIALIFGAINLPVHSISIDKNDHTHHDDDLQSEVSEDSDEYYDAIDDHKWEKESSEEQKHPDNSHNAENQSISEQEKIDADFKRFCEEKDPEYKPLVVNRIRQFFSDKNLPSEKEILNQIANNKEENIVNAILNGIRDAFIIAFGEKDVDKVKKFLMMEHHGKPIINEKALRSAIIRGM